MDIGPTLDVIDGLFEDSCEDEEEVWGRLFPLRKEFVAQNLVKDGYTFGRGEECDYCFDLNGRKNPHFLSLSKTHFRIYREKDKNDPSKYLVFIQDRSSNGTFLNGTKIGRNKKHILNSDDEIALALKKNKAFIFNDCSVCSDLSTLPQEFKEKYTMSKPLGRGACGEVKLAFVNETCRKCAVKIISKKTFSVGPFGRAVKEEVKILQALQHPCIIRIEDVIESQDALYIVLELAEGGELFDRVVDNGKFSEPLAKLYFYQLLSSVKYLHDKGVTHRDLKPENVLLASDDEETLIKVTDFGLSKFVGENSLMKTLCGTPSYLAPEVLQTAGTAGYSKTVDCWSMGVILYIMLGGYPPFSDEIKPYSLHDQICQARYSFPEQYWKGVSSEAIDMIKQLLTLDPGKRISSSAAIDHPWMKDQDVITKARKLMGGNSGCGLPGKVAMPPPNLPSTRKRTAPTSSSDDDDPAHRPAKRATIDTLSPTDETPNSDALATPTSTPMSISQATPTSTPQTTPPNVENGVQSNEGVKKNVSNDSTSSVVSSES